MNYITYEEMVHKCNDIEIEIIRSIKLHRKEAKIYNVYVSVGDEDEGTYFIDVEIGGSPETYNRWYGYYTLPRLKRIFKF